SERSESAARSRRLQQSEAPSMGSGAFNISMVHRGKESVQSGFMVPAVTLLLARRSEILERHCQNLPSQSLNTTHR
ncbi:MAG: hypothetical protein ACK58T_49765, partial [Phycisphaerae bacterium]